MITEKCTDSEYNSLYTAVENARKGAEVVKVSRSTLRNLLLDHQALYRNETPESVKAILHKFDDAPDEAMKAQGIMTGQCCLCGRELTDQESVARGVGPICARNWGF